MNGQFTKHIYYNQNRKSKLGVYTRENNREKSIYHQYYNSSDKIYERYSEEILKEYESKLFKRNKVSTFLYPNGDLLTGIIKGVTPTGLLKVMVEDEAFKLFDLKEIKLLF